MENINLNELALRKVIISGDVIGKFGTFEIEQEYYNNTNSILEVGYTFPIVDTATVVGFEVIVGDKILKGRCKETEKAREEYQRNIVKGNSAYMMEQENDNIFKISIGKIHKNESVKVKIKYIDKFEIVDNTIKILIPTLVTPRYKSKITDKLKYGEVKYSVDFNINISKAVNRKSIYCPSHKINIIDEEKIERIEVLDYDLSKDFKLDIKLKNELSSNAIISKTRDKEEILYLSFMPEILDSYEDSEKEYIFIIDVSGSMEGVKLCETKRAVIECLKQLDEGDKFNIIPFESEFEVMSINSLEFNERNLKKAKEYINNLETLGGTEILNPLKFALYGENTEKVIMLFTDGQVGNEEEIIKYVSEHIGKSRIFSFGIDTNVNSYFIKQLAKVGKGKYELIMPKEKIDEKIIRTFARIQTPLVENLYIDYGKNTVIDEIKEEDSLFNYEFFNVFTKIDKLEDDIKLRGKILNNEYAWVIRKEDIINTNVDLELLYVKQEMDRLEEYKRNTYDFAKEENYKQMIIKLSEKYNINSKYTSFITINERENKIYDVPKYQEIVLSREFARKVSNVQYNATSSIGSLDIPCFLRKKTTNLEISNEETIETIDEKIKEKVIKYYKTFIIQEKKDILTYLLYALYLNQYFNYKDLYEFLEKYRDKIISNNLYKKIICLLYQKAIEESDNQNINKLLDFIDEDYKKIAYTNLKIKIDLKLLNDEEVKEILNSQKVEKNIDDILWYLIFNNIIL